MKNKVARACICLIFALIIFTSLPVLSVSAEKVMFDGFEYAVTNGEAEIIGYEGSDENITIPSEIEGFPVTSIDFCAFKDCEFITSVTIPKGVTSIGEAAFSCCRELTSLTIPEGVTTIGAYAFQSCWSIKIVTIPKSVTTIGESAFNSCIKISEVNYYGTANDWENIEIAEGYGNSYLTRNTIHYLGQNEASINFTKKLGTILGIGLIAIAVIVVCVFFVKKTHN